MPTLAERIKKDQDKLAARMGGDTGSGVSTGVTPSTDLTLDAYPDIFRQINALQQDANLGRIPDAANLESASSARIGELLNPPALFADTSRKAAEFGAGRGVPGSAAAWGTGLRMTDEERLKRIALGESLLSGAYGRNPTATLPDVTKFGITPAQQAQLAEAEKQRASNEYIASLRYRLGAGQYGGQYPTQPGGGMVGAAASNRMRNDPTYLEPNYNWWGGPEGNLAATGSGPWMPGGTSANPGWGANYTPGTLDPNPYTTDEFYYDQMGYGDQAGLDGGLQTSYADFENELYGLGWD